MTQTELAKREKRFPGLRGLHPTGGKFVLDIGSPMTEEEHNAIFQAMYAVARLAELLGLDYNISFEEGACGRD